MSSYLDFEGQYDPKRTFAVTNWSPEDISVNWRDDSGDNVYILHAGETRTYPQYLAYYITQQLVDREMYRDAAKIPENLPSGAPNRARERAEMAVANKDMRKPYEDKTLREVVSGGEAPEVVAMRAQIAERLIVDKSDKQSSEMHNNPDGSPKQEEFAEVPKKRGRPRKTADEAAAAI